jgi:hypothetical protein
MRRDPAHQGFYVVVTREGEPHRFCWKIERRKQPMGVKITECGYPSFAAAYAAGRDALKELLERIHDEETKSA